MYSKKILTRIMLCLLAVVSMFTVVGCKKDTPISETYLFEDQYDNIRYYVKQGYPSDWVKIEGKDGYYLKKIDQYVDGSKGNLIQDCGLIAQFSPSDNVDKVKYSIYTLKYHFMRYTLGDFLLGLVGKSDNLKIELNTLFVEDEENQPRSAFVWTDDINDDKLLESTKVFYNKIQFHKVGYTFTVDGVDWKGIMLVNNQCNEGFYVFTLEAEASVWDSYYSVMEKMLSDFRNRPREIRE